MNSITNLTPQQLRQAADVQEKILELQNELNQLLGGAAQAPTVSAESTTEGPKKRFFTAAAKARMAQAQRERWAKIKGTSPASKPVTPKKKLNDARLKALAKAREARWAKHKAAKNTGNAGVSDGKPKVQRSAAFRRAVSLAAKARWAKAKAAGKSSL